MNYEKLVVGCYTDGCTATFIAGVIQMFGTVCRVIGVLVPSMTNRWQYSKDGDPISESFKLVIYELWSGYGDVRGLACSVVYIASSLVLDAISVFVMYSDVPSYVYNMAAFTGKNKEHHFQTDLATAQTNVSQPGFCRKSSGVSTEIVELINSEYEIPQKEFKYLSVKEELGACG